MSRTSLEQVERQLEELPAERRASAEEAIGALIDVLVVDEQKHLRRLERLSKEQRDSYHVAIRRLFEALFREEQKSLDAFVRSNPEDDPAVDRSRLRLELLAARVQEQSIRGAELSRRWQVSRQRLAQLRDAGKLLGLQPPLRSEYWYPRWQFDPDGSVRPIVPRLLAAAHEARLSPLQLQLLLTNPKAGIEEGRPLVDELDAHPDAVLELVKAAGEIGS